MRGSFGGKPKFQKTTNTSRYFTSLLSELNTKGYNTQGITPETDDNVIYERVFGNTKANYWDNPIFIEVKDKSNSFLNSLTKKIDVKSSIYKCSNCQSDAIQVFHEQRRSGDESMTTILICDNCQHQVKIEG